MSWLFFLLGRIAAVEGDHAKAARLSAVYRVIVEDDGEIDPDNVAETSHYAENYPAEFAEGRAMAIERAVEYALEGESTENNSL